jgi:hypothetical protein
MGWGEGCQWLIEKNFLQMKAVNMRLSGFLRDEFEYSGTGTIN